MTGAPWTSEETAITVLFASSGVRNETIVYLLSQRSAYLLGMSLEANSVALATPPRRTISAIRGKLSSLRLRHPELWHNWRNMERQCGSAISLSLAINRPFTGHIPFEFSSDRNSTHYGDEPSKFRSWKSAGSVLTKYRGNATSFQFPACRCVSKPEAFSRGKVTTQVASQGIKLKFEMGWIELDCRNMFRWNADSVSNEIPSFVTVCM